MRKAVIVLQALLGIFMIAAALPASVLAGAQVYTNPQFSQLTSEHKTVAILPFKVVIDTKRLKGTTIEAIEKMQLDEATEFQHQIYSRLLQKSQEEGYRVSFQDVDQTNALLARAGITLDSLALHTKDEIAKALGVDAVISGTVNQSQPTSQGMALAQTLLIGAHGSTARVDIHMTIHNGADGALLWSYDHTDSGGGFTGSMSNSVEAMTKSLFKKIAGKFPYLAK